VFWKSVYEERLVWVIEFPADIQSSGRIEMRSIATADPVAWCIVSLCVTCLRRAKTAAQIEVLLQMETFGNLKALYIR